VAGLPGGWVQSPAKHWPALHTWVLDFCRDKYQSPSGLTAAAITATVQSFACQQHNEVIRQAVAAEPGSAVDIEQGLPNLVAALVAHFNRRHPGVTEAGYGSA
jgi:hypothetical protein